MEMSLDPETSLAQTLCAASGVPFDTLISGVIDSEGCFAPPDREGFADQRLAGHPQVFAWRRFANAARRARETMARNSQVIVYRRPHFFHGDHEPQKNFWISFFCGKDQAFELSSPWYRSGYYDGGQTICAAVQARSEREAIDIIFRSFDVTPEFLQVYFIHIKPNEWMPFSEGFKRADWMSWNDLADCRN